MNFCEKRTGKIFTELELKNRGIPVDNLSIVKRSGFYPIEYDYIEYDKITQKQEPIEPLEFDEENQIYRQLFRAVPLSEKELQQNLESLQEISIDYINEMTSQDILNGFDAIADDQVLHFSFDDRDQTNFISNQILIITNTLAEKKIEWKAYKLPDGETATPGYKGELVKLLLTPEEFTSIYSESANNKNLKLALGEKKKIAISSAESIEELRILFEDFGINEKELLERNS